VPKEKVKEAPQVAPEEDEVTVDMTTAKTLEPLPTDKPYLMAISKFATGKSGSGGRKVDYELTVVEPTELSGRKVQESISLDNEYTLGRLQQLLISAGMPEDEVKVKNFKIPKEEDVLGMQLTVWVNIRQSEQYGDRNRIRRMRPASAYKEITASV
jgi:hypothetical protein